MLNPVTLIIEHADGQFLIWGSDFLQQDGFILYMYARDFLVWSCLEVL